MKTSITQIWMVCHLLPFAKVGQYYVRGKTILHVLPQVYNFVFVNAGFVHYPFKQGQNSKGFTYMCCSTISELHKSIIGDLHVCTPIVFKFYACINKHMTCEHLPLFYCGKPLFDVHYQMKFHFFDPFLQ